jgi:hypothetical protein
MSAFIKLKNSPKEVELDKDVFDWLSNDPYYQELDLIHSLRLHSSGCAVFQKMVKSGFGKHEILTLYPHRLIAEHYLSDKRPPCPTIVAVLNGNKLDCRLINLAYKPRGKTHLVLNSTNKSGFRGVYIDHNRFRAMITVQGITIHLGMFDTAEEASEAYQKAAQERVNNIF